MFPLKPRTLEGTLVPNTAQPRAVRRRHCVGGGALVNFGPKNIRGGGGAAWAAKNNFTKIPGKDFVLSSKVFR